MNALELAEQLEAGAAFPAYPSMPLVDAADMLRRQHEAIQKLRGALDYYVTQDGIAEGYGAGIGGVALFNAEQALKDTEGL